MEKKDEKGSEDEANSWRPRYYCENSGGSLGQKLVKLFLVLDKNSGGCQEDELISNCV